MSVTKKITIISSISVLLAGLVTASALYMITRSTDMESDMRPVEANTSVEQSFNNKLQSLENEIKSRILEGNTGEVQLVLTEDEVSIMLVKMMKEAMAESADELSEGMVLSSVVNIDPDEVKAIVDIEMYGISVSAGALLQVIVDEQGISLFMYDIEIGQLPFAGSIEDRIMDKFNETHTHMTLKDLHIDIDKDLPVKLKNLVLEDEKMIISGAII